MSLYQLASCAGLMLLLTANVTSALGLGELKVRSTLNEPFSAEIQLNDLGSLNASEIIVSVASQEEFGRNNLERRHFYNEFVFDVVLTNPQRPYVSVKSHSIVREPVLEFIIEARWPSGRVQREFIVLMDKPATLED